MMKITEITTYQLESPLAIPFGWSQGWIDHRTVGLVKLTTDDGLVGWGEGCAGTVATIIHEALAPFLLGADPTNRLGLWERMFHAFYNSNASGGLASSAISAVDIALWDLTGQSAGVPVHALLGGKIRDRVAVYATGLYYTEGEFPNRLLDEAVGYVEMGFRGMKTKVGGLSVAEDAARVAAIRQAIGPEIHLMVDANQAYNAATAVRMGQALADLDILWFEEPVNAKAIDGYRQVKAALPMAIAGGENLHTRFAFKEYIAREAVDILQPDVTIAGGITEMARVAALANSFGIQVNPHVWGSPIMIAASLHVAATLPPCPPARNPLPYQQEPVMEFDRTPSAIRESLADIPIEQKDGYISVPDGPGLGVAIDEAAVLKLSVGRQSSR